MNIYSFTIYQKLSLLREIYFATKAISLLTIGFFMEFVSASFLLRSLQNLCEQIAQPFVAFFQFSEPTQTLNLQKTKFLCPSGA